MRPPAPVDTRAPAPSPLIDPRLRPPAEIVVAKPVGLGLTETRSSEGWRFDVKHAWWIGAVQLILAGFGMPYTAMVLFSLLLLDPLPLPLLLLPLLLLSALGYRGLVNVLGRTRVTLEGDTLVVDTVPLPARRRMRVRASEVREFVAEGRSRKVDNAVVWTLHAVLDGGRRVPLKLPLRERGHAEYLAQRLNQALGEMRQGTGYRG